MQRYRITVRPDLDPAYLLEPDPLGIVCLAESAISALSEARPEVGAVVEALDNERAEGYQAALADAVAWLEKEGRPQTAKRLREALGVQEAGE